MAFDLPAIKFLETLIRENFPDFDIREGTAYRDMLIKPSALIVQPYRDQANVIKRNMSLLNFDTMFEDEMDSLVANVFVDRKGGTPASGVVRVYYSDPKDTSIDQDVVFSTDDRIQFRPISTVTITAESMRLNTESSLFFVDVPSIAAVLGVDGNIESGRIVFVAGSTSAIVRVNNPSAFSGGIDGEPNTKLFRRAKESIGTRDLVTKRSINTVLLEKFSQITNVITSGYGDPEMIRDVVGIPVNYLELLPPATSGSVIGGSTQFTDLSADFILGNVLPGARVIVEVGPNLGVYTITNVTQTILTVSPVFPTTQTSVHYHIHGIFEKADFHVGGKIDIHIGTTTGSISSIIIAPAPEEILVTDTAQAYYENGDAFTLPFVGVSRIFQIDPVTGEQVASDFVEGSDYAIVFLEESTRYSSFELLKIRLLETNPIAPRFFIGATLRIEYYTDATIQEVQTFVTSDLDRVVTASIYIKSSIPTFLDITMKYAGSASDVDLADLINQYVKNIPIGELFEVSDFISSMYFLGVTYIPISELVIRADTRNADGTSVVVTSNDTITIPRNSAFIPRIITVTKI